MQLQRCAATQPRQASAPNKLDLSTCSLNSAARPLRPLTVYHGSPAASLPASSAAARCRCCAASAFAFALRRAASATSCPDIIFAISASSVSSTSSACVASATRAACALPGASRVAAAAQMTTTGSRPRAAVRRAAACRRGGRPPPAPLLPAPRKASLSSSGPLLCAQHQDLQVRCGTACRGFELTCMSRQGIL